MAKRKYCYAIVDKENGALLVWAGLLYWNRREALDLCKPFVKSGYCVTKILLSDLEALILKYQIVK